MPSFSLFEGRHELPVNEGAVCSGFDFAKFKSERTDNWQKLLVAIDEEWEDVLLIVTGLTPALTELLGEIGQMSHRKAHFFLLHYNAATSSYVKQLVFKPILTEGEEELMREYDEQPYYGWCFVCGGETLVGMCNHD